MNQHFKMKKQKPRRIRRLVSGIISENFLSRYVFQVGVVFCKHVTQMNEMREGRQRREASESEIYWRLTNISYVYTHHLIHPTRLISSGFLWVICVHLWLLSAWIISNKMTLYNQIYRLMVMSLMSVIRYSFHKGLVTISQSVLNNIS